MLGWDQNSRKRLDTDGGKIPSEAHGGDNLSTLSRVLNTQIQGPHDILSAQGKGILCLSFAIRGRVQCYSDAHLALIPLNTISKLKKNISKYFKYCPSRPTPHKANSCGGRGEPTFLPFEQRPTTCPFWPCTLENAGRWTGLDVWERMSAAPTRQRLPESLAPATTAHLEKQGVERTPK